jgi:protoheme IX farnesyltransferase
VVVGVLILLTAWYAWRRRRGDALVVWPALLAVPLVLVQGAIGAGRIFVGPNPWIVTVHLLVAMAVVATVMVTAASATVPEGGGEPEHPGIGPLAWTTLWATAAVLLIGAYVRGAHASLVFLDWPLMDGTIVPRLGGEAALVTFLHRGLAAVAVVLGGMLAFRSRRSPHRSIRLLGWAAFGLLLLQAGIGGAVVLTRLAPVAVAGHVAGGSLAWAALVALLTVDGRLRRRAEGGERPTARQVAGAYAQLMKPDIIVLLLITTVPTMILAAGGLPPAGLIAATLVGGTMAAGGANALNHYFDRDIDEVMARTRSRPIPAHAIAPDRAAWFGASLSGLSFVWLATTVNLLAATLALSAIAFYVGVYTLWMKRSTPQNIVIGGAAGAVPVLVGWAAVTGTVGLPAWLLFAVVFFWTPPHFWALSMKYAGDYAEAGVPMLVVVRGGRETAVQIVLYAIQTVAVSLLLAPAAGMGPTYLFAAGALGAAFVWYAAGVLRGGTTRAAMHLFTFSITYLALLFGAVALDTLAGAAA